jgi:hypothetical protein
MPVSTNVGMYLVLNVVLKLIIIWGVHFCVYLWLGGPRGPYSTGSRGKGDLRSQGCLFAELAISQMINHICD